MGKTAGNHTRSLFGRNQRELDDHDPHMALPEVIEGATGMGKIELAEHVARAPM